MLLRVIFHPDETQRIDSANFFITLTRIHISQIMKTNQSIIMNNFFHHVLCVFLTYLVEAQIQMNQHFVLSQCLAPNLANVSVLHHYCCLFAFGVKLVFLFLANFVPAEI